MALAQRVYCCWQVHTLALSYCTRARTIICEGKIERGVYNIPSMSATTQHWLNNDETRTWKLKGPPFPRLRLLYKSCQPPCAETCVWELRDIEGCDLGRLS